MIWDCAVSPGRRDLDVWLSKSQQPKPNTRQLVGIATVGTAAEAQIRKKGMWLVITLSFEMSSSMFKGSAETDALLPFAKEGGPWKSEKENVGD